MCLGELVEVVRVGADTAEVLREGRRLTVSLLVLEEPVVAGDWLVVHAGFALERLTPAEAQEAALIRAATGSEEESS
jgi:hydrogenase expression/formation protein HypC